MACFNYSIITISFRAYLISILYSDWLITLSAITLSFFTRFSSDFHLTCIHFYGNCFNYSIITISFRAYLISILYSDWLFTLSAITLSFFTRFSSDFHLTCIHFFFLLWDIFIFIFDDGMFWKQYFQTFQSY